ncbi:hypothetical protein [Halostella sp. PRR32]|uniref:hypothetical protein n=1 Tax=Halostella sp. PRR32 TaxID=3098147 RepID=UPI002B1D205C|nr:hypothetical protein [Halostella sp. PRR32]
MVSSVAGTFSAVFAPEYFVLLCTLALIGYEWRAAPARNYPGLAVRVGALAAAWAVAYVVYDAGPVLFDTVPEWGPDFTGSLGIAVGFFLLWAVWRLRIWGPLLPALSAVLLGLTVPHLLLTPFWDVSSHVAYAAAPAGYLALLDRRFSPLLAAPVGMVVARPLAGAHTWPESIGGLLLAAGVLACFRYVRGRESDAFNTAAREIRP